MKSGDNVVDEGFPLQKVRIKESLFKKNIYLYKLLTLLIIVKIISTASSHCYIFS
jgi:hypothetical protein